MMMRFFLLIIIPIIPLPDICLAQNPSQNLPCLTSPCCSSYLGSPALGSSQLQQPPPWRKYDNDNDDDDDHRFNLPGLREGLWTIHWLHSLPSLRFWPEHHTAASSSSSSYSHDSSSWHIPTWWECACEPSSLSSLGPGRPSAGRA